jgi:hypothetical protein
MFDREPDTVYGNSGLVGHLEYDRRWSGSRLRFGHLNNLVHRSGKACPLVEWQNFLGSCEASTGLYGASSRIPRLAVFHDNSYLQQIGRGGQNWSNKTRAAISRTIDPARSVNTSRSHRECQPVLGTKEKIRDEAHFVPYFSSDLSNRKCLTGTWLQKSKCLGRFKSD